MWTFQNDIATYEKENSLLIIKLFLVDDGKGVIKTSHETLREQNIEPFKMATIMRELGEAIQLHGIDKFTTFRHCHWCDTLFELKSKKRVWCSDRCRDRNRNLQNQIKKATYDDESEILTWATGKLEEGINIDILTYKDTTCNIFYVNVIDDEDEEILDFYNELKHNNKIDHEDINMDGEAIVIFNKKGNESNGSLMLAYEYAMKKLNDNQFS